MAKILLIQPPVYLAEYSARGSKHTMSILPPLGLAYIASSLQRLGHSCEILDGLVVPLGLEAIAEKARAFDFVGMTAASTLAVRLNETITALKRNGVRAPIIVGGPHATVLPESCLRNGADYVVIGEGEITIAELLQALIDRSDLRNVRGIAFLDQGQYVRTPARPLIANLDDLPLPARELLPRDKYKTSEARAKKQPSLSLFTSRGCPGTCTFCNRAIFGSKVRYFSVPRIVEEFFLLRDVYGARDIAVMDDNFFADREIAHRVCAELIKNKFNLTWSAEARIDAVDRDVLRHAKEAGCDFIAYGVESGSQRVLNSMNKRVTLEQIRAVIKMTKEIGISIRAYFILGLPHETLEDINATIAFAKELDVDVASFTLFLPLPGTVEYSRALKSGSFPDPEYYLHDILPEFNFPDKPLYVPEGLTASQLMSIHKSAYNQYYFRPRFLAKTLSSIRSPDDVLRNFKGFLSLVGNAFSKKRP